MVLKDMAWIRYFLAVLLANLALTLPTHASLLHPDHPCRNAPLLIGVQVSDVDDVFAFRDKHPGEHVVINDLRMTNADFSGRDISKLCFVGGQLIGSNWSGATGEHAYFQGVGLFLSDWRGFDGNYLTFYGSNLNGAFMQRAHITHTEFRYSTMEWVDAIEADLSHGRFFGASIQGFDRSDFSNANLSHFHIACGFRQEDLCGQFGDEVLLRGTDLSHAKVDIGDRDGWDTTGALFDRTQINLRQVNWLRDAEIAGPIDIVQRAGFPLGAFELGFTNDRHSSAFTRFSPREIAAIIGGNDRLAEPTFDCSGSLTEAERLICNEGRDYERTSRYASSDRELNYVYQLALRNGRKVVRDQFVWLRERDACLNKAQSHERAFCVSQAYRSRIEELWREVGFEHTLSLGETRVFVDRFTADLLTQIDTPLLRKKLLRTILLDSHQVIVVHRDQSDRLFARGETIGGNYHLGSMVSPRQGMSFDDESGFYGGFDACGDAPFCPILRFEGRYLQAAHRSQVDTYNDFFMLGARAGFSELVQLPLDKETARKIRDAMHW